MAFAFVAVARGETNDAGSVYDLEQVWTNQNGQAAALESLAGQPTVVAMFFSSCRYACPRITADLKAIEAKLSPEQRARVRFALFSFDAEGDQPAALKAFATRMELDEARWTLFHAPSDSVRELAATLGVSYRREEDGSFSHGNAITVLDARGGIVHQQPGLGADPAGTLDALARLR
jgi:protein SCO1/2